METKIVERHNIVKHNPTSKYIYNRYDLISDDFYTYEIYKCNNLYMCILARIEGQKCYIGASYLSIEKSVYKQLALFILKRHKQVKEIICPSMYFPFGFSIETVNYRIELPLSPDDIHNRITAKSYSELRRRLRMTTDFFGKVDFIEYECPNIPEEVIVKYFEYKSELYRCEYDMSPQKYIENYHVTTAYCMRAGDDILAIIFSCEQFDEVFPENLAFHPDYPRFSLGQILYDWYLTRLVEKGKTILYLGGGDYAYKKRYGSVSQIVYSNIIFRNYFYLFKYLLRKLFHRIRTFLR